MTFLLIVFGLFAFYLWLRGWWFAGLLVFLVYGFGGTQEWGHSWFVAAVIGFGPWVLWTFIRDLRANHSGSTPLRPRQPISLGVLSRQNTGR